MSSGSGTFRQSVIIAREKWSSGRDEIQQRHEAGASGLQTCRDLSNLLDSVLMRLAHSATDDAPNLRQRFALVMHGGCGRGQVAPYSDVDAMLLYQGVLTEELEQFARRYVQDVNDAGLVLGFSLRTPREACSLALQEPEIFTSLTESRLLVGNEEIFRSYFNRLRRISHRRQSKLIARVIKAREDERTQFGETVYLLRPNIKKSKGALRDIHLIRWLGFLRFGKNDLDALQRQRAINATDAQLIKESIEFLLRLRCELHFQVGRAQDGLGRNDQVRIAEKFGYQGREGVLPVEEMMSDYFKYTTEIQYICDHFAKVSSNKKMLGKAIAEPISTREIDQHFWMGPTYIGIFPESLKEMKTDLPEVLRLMQLANLHGKLIGHDTWLAIRQAMQTSEFEITEQASQRFMALLSNTKGLANLLDRLHEMYVLEKLIPGFDHARNLLQFNEYHKYTVDEHSLRAVRKVTKFENDNGVLGKTYRNLRDKNILHLALLLHDLGKGFVEDHSEVGRRIAEETGHYLGLSHDNTEDIKYLVHNHLVMSHLAFHRDINDEQMVAEFAANVGSVRMLSMLFCLTCADIRAVGPDALTPWKKSLLTDLYIHARNLLTGHLGSDHDARFEQIYEQVAQMKPNDKLSDWLFNTSRNLPRNYCRDHSPEDIADQLLTLKNTPGNQLQCWVRKMPKGKLIELCIGKRERRRSGIFFKITGMLASLGMKIHSADIKPMGESLLWYWFQFEDLDFVETPESRLNEIATRARRLSLGDDDGPPRFRKTWIGDGGPAAKLSAPKIQVKIDNETVEQATVIDVFAQQRLGLLYTISKKIFELGLDVQFARISTYGRQVIDVFYVTDDQGNKIRNRNRQVLIQQELTRVIKEFLDKPKTSSSRL
jgi:[protein-PII] uridylyltransferase